MATKKHKAPAAAAPQDSVECARDIKTLGDLARHRDREISVMNDRLAAITGEVQPIIDGLQTQIKRLEEGIQSYCEANRSKLTDEGRTKTGNFLTGTVQWRKRPPSVTVRGMEAVIVKLRELELLKFIRAKVEVNREAILAEPDLIKGIPGLTLVTDIEDFVIVPFEVKAEGS